MQSLLLSQELLSGFAYLDYFMWMKKFHLKVQKYIQNAEWKTKV